MGRTPAWTLMEGSVIGACCTSPCQPAPFKKLAHSGGICQNRGQLVVEQRFYQVAAIGISDDVDFRIIVFDKVFQADTFENTHGFSRERPWRGGKRLV